MIPYFAPGLNDSIAFGEFYMCGIDADILDIFGKTMEN